MFSVLIQVQGICGPVGGALGGGGGLQSVGCPQGSTASVSHGHSVCGTANTVSVQQLHCIIRVAGNELLDWLLYTVF